MFYGCLASFLSSVTWAIGVSSYTMLAREYPPWIVNFTRALVSIPIFFLMVCFSAGGFSEGVATLLLLPTSNILWFALSIFMSYALGDVIFLWSTRGIGISASLAIASTYPLWAAVANWIIRGESMSYLRLLGLILVVGGTIQVILCAKAPKISQSSSGSKFLSKKWVGVILAFTTSLMWAVNAYSVFRGGIGVSTPIANTYRMFFALLFSPLLGLMMARPRKPFYRGPLFKKYLWVFFLEGFGGTYLFMYGLSHAPLAIGTALSSLAPVLVVPAALVTGAEKFSLFRTLGVLVVVAGVILLVSN